MKTFKNFLHRHNEERSGNRDKSPEPSLRRSSSSGTSVQRPRSGSLPARHSFETQDSHPASNSGPPRPGAGQSATPRSLPTGGAAEATRYATSGGQSKCCKSEKQMVQMLARNACKKVLMFARYPFQSCPARLPCAQSHQTKMIAVIHLIAIPLMHSRHVQGFNVDLLGSPIQSRL